MNENMKKASDMLLGFMKKSIKTYWDERNNIEDPRLRIEYDCDHIARIADIGIVIARLGGIKE